MPNPILRPAYRGHFSRIYLVVWCTAIRSSSTRLEIPTCSKLPYFIYTSSKKVYVPKNAQTFGLGRHSAHTLVGSTRMYKRYTFAVSSYCHFGLLPGGDSQRRRRMKGLDAKEKETHLSVLLLLLGSALLCYSSSLSPFGGQGMASLGRSLSLCPPLPICVPGEITTCWRRLLGTCVSLFYADRERPKACFLAPSMPSWGKAEMGFSRQLFALSRQRRPERRRCN